MKSVIDFLIDDYEREFDDYKEWGMNYDDVEYARKNLRDYVDALQARAEKAEATVERMIDIWQRYRTPQNVSSPIAFYMSKFDTSEELDALVAEWKERKDETD